MFGLISRLSTKDKVNAYPNSSLRISRDTIHLYFPLKEVGQDSIANANAIDTFMNCWYSEMLQALNEPILLGLDGDAEIYRFTWLRTFHNPIVIRIERKGGSIELTAKASNGAGGYKPGKLS